MPAPCFNRYRVQQAVSDNLNAKTSLRYFTLILCLLIGSCATPDSDAIRFGLASAPINLDPRFATDATSERINRLLYARLVDFDERARPAPIAGVCMTRRSIS